jgi:hypothetical protein
VPARADEDVLVGERVRSPRISAGYARKNEREVEENSPDADALTVRAA